MRKHGFPAVRRPARADHGARAEKSMNNLFTPLSTARSALAKK
jgi:hypothetical protein